MTTLLDTLPAHDDIGRSYTERRVQQAGADVIARARRASSMPEAAPPPAPAEAPEGSFLADVGAVAADLGRGVTEAPRAVYNGVVDAATEFSDTLMRVSDPVAQYLESQLPLGEAPSAEELFGSIRMADPKSETGQAVQKVSQFLTGFLPALKATKALGLASSMGRAGKAAEGIIAGSLADVAVLDEQDKRLADLVQSVPSLQNPLTEFLASDPDDSLAEGKLKQAAEGAGLGVASELLVGTVRTIARARRATGAAAQADEAVRQARANPTPAALSPDEAAKLGDPAAPLFQDTAETRLAADAFLSGEVPITGNVPARVGNINMARIGGPEDVREAIARTAALFEDKVTHGIQSNNQTVALANEIAADPERLASILTRQDGTAFNAAEVTALRFLLHESGNTLRSLSVQIGSGAATEADRFAFRRQMALHAALLEQTSAGAREAGRALQAFNITAKGGQEQIRAIRNLLGEPGAGNLDRMAAEMLSTLGTPAGLNTFVKQARKAKTSEMLFEYWINSLLSGPQTHVVNALSNSLVAMWQIPERKLAAAIRQMTGGQGVEVGEATAQTFGLVHGIRDGLRLAGQALRTGEPSDVLGKIEGLQHRAITGANMGLEQGGTAARAVDLLGEVVRVPGRFLTASDEFFKAVGYRMELQAQAFRQASHEGLQGPDMARRIQEIIADPPESLRMSAIDAAHYQTFTRPLGEGGRYFQRAVSAFPAARVIFPFIRTPVNILKFVGERTPVAPLSKAVRQEIAAGGARRDLALAKISLGSLIMAAAAEMATGGAITGGGPTNPDLRNALRRKGWQPYSVKVGDNYVSYNRLDPLGMTMGIAADMSDILGQAETAEGEAVAAAAVMAVSQNVVSKTWMQGLANAMEAFAGPSPEYGATAAERFLRGLVGTLVPTGVAQVARTADPTLRQVQGMVEALKSRIPGLSETLPPRLNLWGDPIMLTGGVGPDIMSPLWQSPIRESPADDLIIKNDVSVSMPSRSLRSVELEPLEYNRYVALAGNELKDPSSGLGARETLEAIAEGRHPLAEQFAAASDGPEGGKALIVREVIHQFREAAKAQLLAEMPELRARIELRERAKAEALRR